MRVEIIKYTDDTLIIRKITNNDSAKYFNAVYEIENWCKDNLLVLNSGKTKEIIFDTRKEKRTWESVKIDGAPIEKTSSIKYLGCQIDDRLNFSINAEKTIKKAKSRRHLVYKLYEFNVDKHLITLAYTSLVRSVISYAVPCYINLLRRDTRKKLAKIYNTCRSPTADNFDQIVQKKMLQLGTRITQNFAHPLHDYLKLLPSGRRFDIPFCRTTRFQNSFVPHVTMVLNTQQQSQRVS